MTAAIEHVPADMTVTADASLTLAALQKELAKGGQWLPVDPPAARTVTLADLLAHNLSGPRRCGYGTILDYAIGMKVRLADGRTIKTGGKVVKNVAGYDLPKLFIGAAHSLGVIVEATFKLRPLPVLEQFLQRPCASLTEAGAAISGVLESPLTPTVLDLHNVKSNAPVLVLGFDGHREEVEWQMSVARSLGFRDPGSLEYDNAFWSTGTDSIHKVSLLPSRLIATLSEGSCGEFVARAANGILYCRGGPRRLAEDLPTHLFQRAREAFHPIP